jgi:hypothetical protein
VWIALFGNLDLGPGQMQTCFNGSETGSNGVGARSKNERVLTATRRRRREGRQGGEGIEVGRGAAG